MDEKKEERDERVAQSTRPENWPGIPRKSEQPEEGEAKTTQAQRELEEQVSASRDAAPEDRKKRPRGPRAWM